MMSITGMKIQKLKLLVFFKDMLYYIGYDNRRNKQINKEGN